MNILAVRTDKLGDFITSLPAMYVLKQYNPDNRIIALVAPLNEALARSCDFIDAVIVDDTQRSFFHLAKELRKFKIDASITLFSNTRVALAQCFARIPIRIAPATKIAQILYTHRVTQRRSAVKMAEFEYNLELTKELFPNINLEYKKPLLEFSDAQKVYDVFCINNEIQREIIAFHVGFGGSSDANLNLDEYEILIDTLLQTKKYQVVLTFGPDEKELYEEMQLRLAGKDVVFYLSLDGLLYFAKLISKFKLFVSTSTGTYHLASLVGTPTITFFADTLFASAKRWRGVGEKKLQQHFMLSTKQEKKQKILTALQRAFVDAI